MAFKAEPTQDQLDSEMPELPNPNKLKPFPARMRMQLHTQYRAVKVICQSDLLFILTFNSLEI